MLHDMTVDENHSYQVNKNIVHNCLTTQNTGVGYPMASLIKECYEISTTLKNPAYIVADGGMKDYSDIIKALALGADFVMLGSVLNKSLESSGENYLWKRIKVSQKIAEWAYSLKIPVYKKFRGMSTKEVQKKWGAKTIKTSEGVVRFRKVEYTLEKWVENFEHYLRSAMSYSGAHNLKEFTNQTELVQITDNAFKRFNK
jgi:isopentenyl diphosphate isomerase/L-lactate dehydrogenase-like FMN-dependent dehydrogenase